MEARWKDKEKVTSAMMFQKIARLGGIFEVDEKRHGCYSWVDQPEEYDTDCLFPSCYGTKYYSVGCSVFP